MKSSQLHAAPRVIVIDDFLSADECGHLIQLARPFMQSAVVVDETTGQFIEHSARSSSNTYIAAGRDAIADAIAQRLADYAQLPLENGESLQVLHYAIGGEYRAHYDYFDPALPGSQTVLAQGGQRIVTFVLYLNDVEQGGETTFPALNLQVQPRQGRAVMFDNIKTDGSLEPLSLHASAPVIAGEKWALTRWIRERRWN